MMPPIEPRRLRQWLEPLNLSLADLLEETATRQAEIVRWLLPVEGEAGGEGGPTQSEDRAALAVLGWALASHTLAATGFKTVLVALTDLFLAIEEPEISESLFRQAYPEAETLVTYFSKLVELKLAQADMAGAAQVLAEMQQAHPARFTTLTTAALIHTYNGAFDDAKVALLKAWQDSPNSLSLLLKLAECDFKAGKLTEVRDWLERIEAREGWPQTNWLQLRQLARLWGGIGEAEKAAWLEAASLKQRAMRQAELAANEKKRPAREPASSASGAGRVKVVAEESGLEIVPDFTAPEAGAGVGDAAFQVLRRVFGHAEFRPGQEQVIASVLAGHNTLAVLPTGAGKSLCYQLPALLLPGPVLVLSPLISLMKDQFDKLPAALKGHTVIINSSLEPGEAARQMREVARPGSGVRLIYAAPERLRQQPFVRALSRAGLGLVVVDEAHCVAMWGNDFRPDYLFIRRVLDDLPATNLLAVTATATPAVADEIGRQLGREMTLVRGSVYRSNLRFGVEKVKTGGNHRIERVAEIVSGLEGTGIIYARSRDKCEEVAAYLTRQGVAAAYYHAGLENTARQRVQEAWSSGRNRVIVATIAFGMGIDKPDVRYILHLNPPASLENYVQEAGRAGRDGQPSDCLMLYTSSDKANLTRWQREERERLNLEALRGIYRALTRQLGRSRRGVVILVELLMRLNDLNPPPDETTLRVGLSLLERAGLLERSYDLPPTAQVRLGLFRPDLPELVSFGQAADLTAGEERQLDLLYVADNLGISLAELELRLLDWAEGGFLVYSPARRDAYIELKEAGNDARARLETILEGMGVAANHRLDQLESFFKERTCRQVLLARHFGEKLVKPCGICDNCTAKAGSARPSRLESAAAPFAALPSSRRTNGADDDLSALPEALIFPEESHPESINLQVGARDLRAVTPPVSKPTPKAPKLDDNELTELVLKCLHMLSGGEAKVGRTGLVRLLLGQQTALGTRANNPYKGSLEGKLKVKELEGVIERLVTSGLIEEETARRAMGGTYQALRVSEGGLSWLEGIYS